MIDGILRQSTAVTVKSKTFRDRTDAVTAETALTIQKTNVRLDKNGGTMAAASADQGSSDVGAPHDALGKYDLSLNTTDTNTLGLLDLTIDNANALPIEMRFFVVTAAVWDSWCSTGYLPVDVTRWVTGTPNALQSGRVDSYLGAVASGVIAAGSFAANALDAVWSTATRTLTGFSTALAVSVWDVLASAVATASSIGLQIKTNLDAAVTSRSSHTAAQAGTDAASKVLATPANLLATDSSGRTLLQPTQAGVTIPTVTTLTNDAGITQAGADKVWGTTVRALTDKVNFALSSAGIQGIWDALTSALTTAGSIGKLLVDNINATISSRLATAGYTAPLDAAATRTALGLASANLDTQLAALATASALATLQTTATNIYGKVDTEVQAIIDALAIINADTDDIQSRLPAALVGGRMDSNASAINSSTAAAIRLALSAGVIIPGTVDTAGFSPTTTVFEASDITTAAANHYAGRVIIFTSGSLIGQAVAISAYSLATGRGHFTVSALTAAPANGVTFVVV